MVYPGDGPFRSEKLELSPLCCIAPGKFAETKIIADSKSRRDVTDIEESPFFTWKQEFLFIHQRYQVDLVIACDITA